MMDTKFLDEHKELLGRNSNDKDDTTTNQVQTTNLQEPVIALEEMPIFF